MYHFLSISTSPSLSLPPYLFTLPHSSISCPCYSFILKMASRLTMRTHLQRTLLSGLSLASHSSSLTTRSVSPLLLRAFATESGSGFLGRTHKDQKDLVHGEPSGPKIVTSTFPGPKTKAGLKHLDSLQDSRAATMMTGEFPSFGPSPFPHPFFFC